MKKSSRKIFFDNQEKTAYYIIPDVNTMSDNNLRNHLCVPWFNGMCEKCEYKCVYGKEYIKRRNKHG